MPVPNSLRTGTLARWSSPNRRLSLSSATNARVILLSNPHKMQVLNGQEKVFSQSQRSCNALTKSIRSFPESSGNKKICQMLACYAKIVASDMDIEMELFLCTEVM